MAGPRILIDANVLYPTVMRELVLGVAGQGLFTPLWSDRILEEWRLAAAKLGPEGIPQAEAEIALLRRDWPDAVVTPGLEKARALWLPDPDDVHVLAAAVEARAQSIMTRNARDFPTRLLAESGITRVDPDGYLRDLWREAPDTVAAVAESVRAEAERLSGQGWALNDLLKKARMPQLAKALRTSAQLPGHSSQRS